MKVKSSSDKKTLKKYSRDRSIYSIKPKQVFFPKNEEEVQDIIAYARKKKLHIAPRGGGTGLSGAALSKDIVIDFSKHFKNIVTLKKNLRVQSGMLLRNLRPKIEKAGFMLPGVPLHGDCAIGGNVNTRSIGPRTLKYGTFDKQVKSLRAVLADGRILDTKKKIPEDITKKVLDLQKEFKKDKKTADYVKKRPLVAGGYNLKAFLEHKNINDLITHLLVGSTGTLALITEVEIALHKLKPMKDVYLLHFKSLDDIQKVMNRVLKLDPIAIEYAGKKALDLWDKQYHHKDAMAAVIIAFETKRNIVKIAKEALAIKFIPESKRKHLWKSRALALPKLEQSAKRKGMHLPSGIDDTTFHPKDFAKIMKAVRAYEKKNKLNIASFGHIGVGSMHLRAYIDIKRQAKQLDKIGKDIFKIVKKYNGTLVGEHNAGLCRSRYLEMESKKMYNYMKKLKKIFDPTNTLNPHVLFNLKPIIRDISLQ